MTEPTLETILLTADQIHDRVCDLGRQIAQDYPEPVDLHLICVLKGAFMFLADLVRAIDRTVTFDFMAVSSYAKGTTSSATKERNRAASPCSRPSSRKGTATGERSRWRSRS